VRTLNTAGQALLSRLLAGEQIPVPLLVQFDLDVVQRVSTAGIPLVWGGHTWQPTEIVVSPIEDDEAEFMNLSFTLPGVTESQLALALTEDVEGKRARVWMAFVDPDTGTVADAPLVWSGELDVPALQDGPQASVTVNAEHRGNLALRPRTRRYTHDEQQRIAPGDTALDVDAGTDRPPLQWPLASWFYR
jgi:hypothetical protein